jgi:DNA-binding beta-propeller fold protein YncE
MSLRHVADIDLPEHLRQGGFDHAAAHRQSARLYVAHTANDAVDVIDCRRDCYLYSVADLPGVAGVLVSDERDLVFTSNRGENTIAILSGSGEARRVKVSVGIAPNGLAYDPRRDHLLVAHVGSPAVKDSFTLSVVDVRNETRLASVPVAGRTRWTLFDAGADVFYVNIADPPQIVAVGAIEPFRVVRAFSISSAGPHGLDLDREQARLFCACDGGKLFSLDARSGKVLAESDLSGVPDVVFFNAALKRLYVAIGDPGVIDVFDTERMRRSETVRTERGAHTIGFDPARNKVYAFLPGSHRAAVYVDG